MTQKTLYIGTLKTNRSNPIAIFSNGTGSYYPQTIPINDDELIRYLRKAAGYVVSFLNTPEQITLGSQHFEAKPLETSERVSLELKLKKERIIVH